MTPTEELKAEHRAIKRMLAILSKTCDRVEAGGSVDSGHFEAAVEFVQVFADKCHHAKEEDLLFPAMVAAGVPDERGPIGVMKAEHVRGRAFIRQVKESIPGFRSGAPGAATALVQGIRGYVALLDPHIDKEDFVLYPLADRVLSRRVLDGLAERFKQVEREVVGDGTHERFHRLLEELERAYPKA